MQALYIDDSYLKEFDAKVVSLKDGKFIILDQTAFYPKSGGQPNDIGKIIRKSDNKEFEVIFVGKFNNQISHQITPENELKEGDEVHCTIDWDRRYQLMKMHTASHILSAIINKETGAMITGNQLDIEKSRIDFSLENFDKEKMHYYIDMTNNEINKDRKINIEFTTKQKLEADPSLLKLAKGLPDNIGEIRLIEIEGLDTQPDGGTHVHSTKEIGKLKFIKADNKGKSNRRVYFEII